jgi:hypothetical protein
MYPSASIKQTLTRALRPESAQADFTVLRCQGSRARSEAREERMGGIHYPGGKTLQFKTSSRQH